MVKYILKEFHINSVITEKASRVFALPLYLALSAILILIEIYRLLIYVVLKLIHGERFHSLMTGMEPAFNFTETETSNILIVNFLLVDYPGTGEEFLKTAKIHIENAFSRSKFEKMHLTRKFFCGYYYYLKGELRVDSCVKSFLNKPIKSEDLPECISEIYTKPMPRNNCGMWDVYVGLNKVTDRNAYPIFFRFHHTLCDASTIFNIFARDFAGGPENGVHLKETIMKPRPIIARNLKQCSMSQCFIIDKCHKSFFYNSKIKLTGDKELLWFSDDSDKYLNMIKRIKKANGCFFANVILTAVSSSLYDYSKKKSDDLPRLMTSFVPIFVPWYKPCNYGDVENYDISTKVSVAVFNVPLEMEIDNETEDLRRRLKAITKKYNTIKNESLDIMFNRWVGSVLFKLLPKYIAKAFCLLPQPAFVMSNLPGCDHLDIFGGCAVKELVSFTPNAPFSGVSTLITTYENRLNIAFVFDKTLIPCAEDRQQIYSSVLRKIEKLDEIS